MADDGSAQSAATWPMAKFSFRVKWEDNELIFQEVTGLGPGTQVAEVGNITLKKGICKGDAALWDSINQVKMNTIRRSTVLISLLDETNAVVMSWSLLNAFPTKMTGADMKPDTNEAAIEVMELAHDGVTLIK
ncbi:MAG TPA: phage tail protein [Mucilaginibacter sp.]|jgi:phage tail-like protein|nr:phage tail protein [Mucilaginibacter sp.]